MTKSKSVRILALVFLGAFAVEVVGAAADDVRVAIVGEEKAAILSENDLSVVASMPLPKGWVEGLWVSEDGARLTVLTGEGLFGAKAPADLTIYDLAELKIIGQHELSFTHRVEAIAADGKTGYLVFKDHKAKKGYAAEPPLLFRWDAASGTVVGGIPVDAVPESIHLLEEAGLVVLAYHGVPENNPEKRVSGRLEVFDALSLKRERVIPLPGPVVDVTADNRSILFATDPGTDRKKPEQTIKGRVYVVDPTREKLVADLEIGIGANLLSWDDQREVFYVITRAGKAKTTAASFQMIQGNSVVAKIDLAHDPHGVVPAPDRSVYYVLDEDGISVVSNDLAKVERHIPLAGHASNLLFLDPPSRAFVSHLGSSQVSVVDLAESHVLADITTGRSGKKILLAVAAAWNQYEYTVPNPETSGLISPDGKIAFLRNTQTEDLTAVDTGTFEVIDKFPGSGPTVILDGTALAALKVKDLVIFDLKTRTALPEVTVGMGVSYISPSGNYVWTSFGTKTAVLDLATRRRVKEFEGLSAGIDFLPPLRPEPEIDPAPPTEEQTASEERSPSSCLY